MGGHTLAGWPSGVWTQSGKVACWSHAHLGTHFHKATVTEQECQPCLVFALHPGIHLTTEEKSWRNLSQCRWKVPSWKALGMIRCVDLATDLQAASTGLLTSVTLGLRFRWPGSTLGQLEYQLNCQDKRLLTPTNFELNPRPGVWCGQQRMDLPYNLEFACNFWTHCGVTLRLSTIQIMDTT